MFSKHQKNGYSCKNTRKQDCLYKKLQYTSSSIFTTTCTKCDSYHMFANKTQRNMSH